MKHELPKLGYEYNALEPYIDAKTMEIHHTKHHQAYIDKLNAALEKYPELQKKKVEDLLKDLNKIPEDIRTAVKNHGGGTYNHTLWWKILKKDVKPHGKILEAINKEFDSLEEFKRRFTAIALSVFGSGWVWLVVNKRKLEIVMTANQDCPISEGKIPILLIDVWEHSYYLLYNQRRADYITAFYNVINWEYVDELYTLALEGKSFSI